MHRAFKLPPLTRSGDQWPHFGAFFVVRIRRERPAVKLKLKLKRPLAPRARRLRHEGQHSGRGAQAHRVLLRRGGAVLRLSPVE
eukprot:scaffold585_cov237-Pinguiococcus_pyrenoidosus.AAC.3